MIFEGTTKTTTTPEEACGNTDMRNNGLEQRAWEGSHQDCDRVTLGKSWPDYLPKHGSNSQSQQQSKSVRFRSVVFNLQHTKIYSKANSKTYHVNCLKILQAVGHFSVGKAPEIPHHCPETTAPGVLGIHLKTPMSRSRLATPTL